MFCDLVGSTLLATRLDPEDLREVFGKYHRSIAETIAHFDGFVAKYMGDGVLVYFGYPQAHEDDAERAVRAGLALGQAVQALRPKGGRTCGSDRHRHWFGGGRRSDRLRRGQGWRQTWRLDCNLWRAEGGGDRIRDPASRWRAVRVRRACADVCEGLRRTGTSLAGAARERGR
jgi:adenylate/guanylate cyclase family protein